MVEKDHKECIIQLFTKESHHWLIVATTTEFAMGVELPDMRQVNSSGCPDDIEAYAQQSGRVGRDGVRSLALL